MHVDHDRATLRLVRWSWRVVLGVVVDDGRVASLRLADPAATAADHDQHEPGPDARHHHAARVAVHVASAAAEIVS